MNSDVTILELPHNIRAIVLEMSPDIRIHPVSAQRQMVEDRFKAVCSEAAFRLRVTVNAGAGPQGAPLCH